MNTHPGKDAMTESSSDAREMTITRVFDAPLEAVWKAFTEPEQFASWFSTPPFTTPVSTVSLDVRPGGEWRATMVSEDDGTELPFVGVYREVVERERLVMTMDNPEDRDDPNVELLTINFTDLGDKTEVVARQEGHLPPEEYRQLEEGYAAFFDRLAERLASA
jgi:uncharacterized protein YndB with AHSA1/START domain